MLARGQEERFGPFCGLDHALVFVCGQINQRGLVFVLLHAGQSGLF